MAFLTFAGSDREESVNWLAASLVSTAVSELGHAVESQRLETLNLPLYRQVAEQSTGYPSSLCDFRSSVQKADGLIIGCPEFNGLITPLLLNTLTWLTRSDKGAPDLSAFRLKPVLICSSSPGGLGGIRAAAELANYLRGIGAIVFPEFFIVPQAFSVFSEPNLASDHPLTARANEIALAFTELAKKV